MLCNACSKTSSSIKQELGSDTITIKVICFDVHCDNVYDPTGYIKNTHTNCDCFDKYDIDIRRLVHRDK